MRETSFDEVTLYFDKLFKIEGKLRSILENEANDASAHIQTMINTLKRASAGGSPNPNPQLPFLERFCETLPYLALEYEDGEMADFLNHFVPLLQNYAAVVDVGRVHRLADTLGKLALMRGSFTELLVLAHRLVKQYDYAKGYMPETVSISKRYIQQLLGEE